jgi:hypothetical protein
MGVLEQPTGNLFALLLPEFRTLGATMTATSQAGPKPGGFTRSSTPSTALTLLSSGALDFGVDALDVRTLQAGGVGRATVRWSYASENYRSWDPPVLVTGFEFVNRTTVASRWIRPHVARIPSTGSVVAVASKNLNDIACWRQLHTSTARGTWSETEVAATGNNTVGCIVPLPSGRLVALYTYQTATARSQIRMSFSDDAGATWALGSSACLASDLAKASTAYKRIRAVELNGLLSVLLWEQDTTDTLYQYVSTDGGASLGLVETFSTANRAAPDMAVSRGVIYVATAEYVSGRASSTLVPYVRALASASMPLSSVTGVDAAATTSGAYEWAVRTGVLLTSAECAILADDDGRLWLYGQNYDAAGTNETMARVSTDLGTNWEFNFNSSIGGGTPLYVGDSTSYLRDIAVAPERGRAVLLHRSLAGGGASDSLCASYLGGWSSVGMPQDEVSTLTNRGFVGFDQLWLPIDKPQNTAGGLATETLSGAATSTLGSSGLTLDAGALENAYYTEAPVTSGAPTSGVLYEWHLLMTSGTAVHSLTISDGSANSYSVRVSVTTTTVTLRDMVAGANIGSAYSIDTTKGIALRIAIDKGSGAWGTAVGRVRAWVRPDGPYSGATINYGPRADRYWTQVESSTTLAAGSATASAASWGIVSGSAATVTYRLRGSSSGTYVAGNILASPAGTSRGRVISSASSPLHLAYGLRAHALGGPTQAGDTWRHTTAYEYPVEAIDPQRHPSPRRRHRSTTDATDHDIVYSGIDLGWRAGDALGVLVLGTNVPSMSLYSGAGAGVLVATMDMRITGLGYTRSRGQIIPATGAALPWQASEGVLRGARVDLGTGIIRKVRHNQAGAWQATGAPGTYASTRLQLEDYDSGDPSSGTLDLWMPGGFFMTEALTATDTLTLRIPAATTREDYFEIGTVLIGRVRILRQPAWGRSVRFSPSYSLTTSATGARTARALGPGRRAFGLTWDDGFNTSPIHIAGTAPNFISLGYSGADALASFADTPRTLSGILQEHDGAGLPLGYLPAIPQRSSATSAASPYRDLDPNGAIYCRALTETLRTDAVLGDEQVDEHVKVGLVDLEEEL